MARWTFGLLALAALAFPLGSPAGAEDAAAVAWTDTTTRVAQADAPHYLQIRITKAAHVALRHRAAAAEATWQEGGSWSLVGKRVEMARALEGLRGAMAAAIQSVEPRDADGTSLARVLLDVEPEAPWKLVQWAVQTAASPQTKLWRLTFLVPGREAVDIDLPKDRGLAGLQDRPSALLLSLAFQRPEVEGTPPFTQVAVSARPEPKGQAAEEDIEPEDERDPVPTHEDPPVKVRLAPDGADAAAAEAAWKEVADVLAERAKGASLLRGLISASPPTGGETPYRDVLRGAALLRAAGAKDLALEGGVTPLPR